MVRSVECGRGGGETAVWSGAAWRCTMPSVADDVAYGCWRDGGLSSSSTSRTRREAEAEIAHRNWRPPFPQQHAQRAAAARPQPVGGRWTRPFRTSTSRASSNMCWWVLDIRVPEREPGDHRHDSVLLGPGLCRQERRPFRPAQSSGKSARRVPEPHYIFATWQNAGLRVFDISNAVSSRGDRLLRSTAAHGMVGTNARAREVRHTADIFVSQDGLIYITDYDAGLYILQWNGK